MDGATNSFVKNTIVPMRNSGDAATPRRSYWTVRREVAETEAEGQVDVNAGAPADLLFVNPGKTGRIGYEAGYRLVPGGLAAGRRRLPAAPRRVHQEAGLGDAVQQVGEVGVRAVRRAEHRGRQPGRLEQEEPED